jgi:hypothetical protein
MGKYREVVSTKLNVKLLSYTELYDNTFRPGLLDGQHYCVLKVFRFKDVIWQSGVFAFGILPLQNVMRDMSLQFAEPPFELRWALFVFGSSSEKIVITTTPLNSLLDFSFKARILRARLKSGGAAGLIISSVRSAVASYRKKTISSPKPKLSGIKTQRQSPELKDAVTYYKTVNIIDGSVASNIPGTYRILYRAFIGVRTPNFKKLARTGQLPVNDYTLYRVIMARGSYYHLYQYLHKPTKVTAGTIETANYAPNLVWTDLPSGHLGVDENIVISRLQNKIVGSTANVGEDAATAVQTLRLFTNNVKRLGTLISLLRKGDIAGYVKLLGNARGKKRIKSAWNRLNREGLAGPKLLSELWLEYRYGWLPLLSDIEASLNAYSRYVARNPRILTVTASASKSSLATTYISNLAVITPGKLCATRLSHTRTKCKIGLHYHVSDPVKSMFSQLGLTSPISLGWELIPFSFVIDWFLPIGAALNAASAFDGLTFHSGYKAYRTEKRSQIDYNLSDTSTDATYDRKEQISGSGTGTSIHYTRTKLTSFPSARVPTVKNPVSLIHAANAVALVIANLR